MEVDYGALGKRIRKVRKERGMTQEQLAERIDVCPPHMSNIENGKTKFSLQKFWEIVNVLETTPDTLLLDHPLKADGERGLLLEEIDEVLSDCTVAQIKVMKTQLCATKEMLKNYDIGKKE